MINSAVDWYRCPGPETYSEHGNGDPKKADLAGRKEPLPRRTRKIDGIFRQKGKASELFSYCSINTYTYIF